MEMELIAKALSACTDRSLMTQGESHVIWP